MADLHAWSHSLDLLGELTLGSFTGLGQRGFGHAEPIPLFAMKLARALAGRPIRALIGVIHLARGEWGLVTPSKV